MQSDHRTGDDHRRRQPRQGESLAADMLFGAIAGAIGVWAMDQVDWYIYDREDPRARQRTQSVRPAGRDPAHNIVGRAAEMMGHEAPDQPNAAGVAVHYALGVGPGAIYGALHDKAPRVRSGRGLAYGFALFVTQDEIFNAATGLSADPRKYPWQAHARGLIAHLVLGVVTDTVLSVLKGSGRPLRFPDPADGAGGERFPPTVSASASRSSTTRTPSASAAATR